MSSKAWVTATYMPGRDESPTSRVSPNGRWAAIDLHEGPGRFVVQLGTDDATETANAVRYLRELAAEATKIADQLEAPLDEEYAR
ncbi:MAG TPA: hypothetical protein VG497_30590 [Kribbella sp.]|nr:hypothetical protein [Kribbella sp.]